MVLPAPDIKNDIANSVDNLQKLYPGEFDAKKHLYLPHGKYAFAAEHKFQGKNKKQIGLRSGYGYRINIRSGVIAGHNVTCLWKTWDVSKAWKEFFQELYFYSHPELLRWLQGTVVSHVIGVHDEPNGQKSIFMEAPHHTHWHTAHPDLSIGEKQAVIRAYEALHAHGIMHNNISVHNICIDQDMNVTLLNFERSCCLKDKGIDAVPGCDQEALAREMRQVKFLISYMDARLIEAEIITASQASPSEQQIEPLDLDDIVRWLKDVENTHTIPIDMRNRPLPNDGRKRAKKPKVKAGAIIRWDSAGSMRDADNAGFHSEPIVPPILLPISQSFSSTIIATPSPQLNPPANRHGFFSVDQLPPSNSRGALLSNCPEENTSHTQDGDINMQLPLFRSDPEGTASNGLHDIPVHSPPASPLAPPPLLPTPMSDTSERIPQTPPTCPLLAHLASPPSPDYPQIRTFAPYPDQPPSPKVFCDLTHEQLRLAIKQHNVVVDTRLSSQATINTDKNNVVFHPDTNDNGTYATGSDPFRKRKKRRRPTPFFSECFISSEEETVPDEHEEDEEPEPEVEVDFEELVEEAHLAKLRGRRRVSRSGVLPAMVPAKSMWPGPEAKPPVVAQRSTSMPSLPALSSVSEEASSGDTSGAPPYTVVFLGANGSPDEVWKLPVPAFMLIKSSVARQPQAQKLRVEQVPRLRGPPPSMNSSPSRAPDQDAQSRFSKKRKIDCVEGIEYLEQTSKRARQGQLTPSSCVIC
ncbi:hypothetical protein DEU56DRAFT_770301 [Suillus clintonianus]|uniref:uncharacterized protein n=1 Tax=Suillus clintonianus TaxID=1904413 RepID=UPI001B86B864|nr:uncharacterized protein DEU56DRAFT_770301 [Suillus clintonianus]KAG2154782.1 hypothetical protein DEU56DRAFT_770301 [Suillus clintonianus]